jgi:predicted enzyme related to lactoylglutathione lyase
MPSQWPHGTFCWLEHATPNIDGAKAFYKDILELSTKELPMPGDQPGNYTMWLADGDKEIGGVHVLADDEQHKNVPPHWMPYIAVDGIDDVVARAKDLGARVTVEPFDIPNTGRMALLCDPTDANFALWSRDGNHAGGFKPEGAPSVGMPCWHELLTKDTDKAIAFYGELLGWSHSSRDIPYMPGAQYHMFSLGEQPVAGMMAIAEDWGPMPPNWAVYFVVADIDKAVEAVKAKGGQAPMPVMAMEGVGRFAMFVDAMGAAFSVLEPASK